MPKTVAGDLMPCRMDAPNLGRVMVGGRPVKGRRAYYRKTSGQVIFSVKVEQAVGRGEF
jgi:hypothetical protein